ncbi:MAG TPA: ribosome silencing factor [Thermoanaerobaculia bacterium]|nr:ribosome silencing factor [Thermoanaerobaculia bacterium]HUM29366.1 ribosome silencing factor [Thermoanaerobaculia bacterium]HXK67612.1 ribosome silencing factor [Thermoanaerobaculia bacterium]
MPKPKSLPSSARLVREAALTAQEKLAEDLLILSLQDVTSFTDYFLIMTVHSDKQAKAVSDAVQERLKSFRAKPLHEEGYSSGTWVLLDYVDFIIHIFQPEQRDFYALERLWGDAPDVTEKLLT